MTISNEQVSKLAGSFEEVLQEMSEQGCLNEDGALNLIRKSGDLKTGIRFLINKLSLSNFAGEEAECSACYGEFYSPRNFDEQVEILKNAFPELCSASYGIASGKVPDKAECWFAVPRWQIVAETYPEAVRKIFSLLNQRGCRLFNYYESHLNRGEISRAEETAKAIDELFASQKNDILAVPCQLGMLHCGQSVRRALENREKNGEFGLGAFEMGCIILVHPQLLSIEKDLCLFCPGDECIPEGEADITLGVPFFCVFAGEMIFKVHWRDAAHGAMGQATGFLI
jgi:hypothetical protein